jgi:hypothetical protein
MDLIYADENFIDLGVLQDYSFDECFGDEDNSFECRVQKYNHVCDQDYILYVEGKEYGGIIDRIESDTRTGEITYSGRSWYGVLNSYVITPPSGYAYRTFSGTANEVLAEMLELFDMSNLFVVDVPNGVEDIDIDNFEVRYEPVYDALRRMMETCNGKLKCYYKRGHVHLYIVLLANYAVSDGFDASQVPFKVGTTYNNVNHLICLGQGEGVQRAVIHLFTDEGGGIQPYRRIENPQEDADYYLDTSQQVMTGIAEITDIFDYPSAEIIYNYKRLNSQPSDWTTQYYKKYYTGSLDSDGKPTYSLVEQKFIKKFKQLFGDAPKDWYVNDNYTNYYYIDDSDPDDPVFANVRGLSDSLATPVYIPMDTAHGFEEAPKDWDTDYSSYYKWSDAHQEYQSVEGVSKLKEEQILSMPADWKGNYGLYSTRTWNGYMWIYTAVPPRKAQRFKLQTEKPTDWDTNFRNYHYIYYDKTLTSGHGYSKVSAGLRDGDLKLKKDGTLKWKKNLFYTMEEYDVAPTFKKIQRQHESTGGIWKVTEYKEAPPFVNDGSYFYKDYVRTPAWNGNGYYWELISDHWEDIPTFANNTYYYQVEDRMAELVEAGIERLNDLRDTSTLDIDLELESQYDVGDIVGSIDNVTGIEVNKPILREIVKIKKDILSIEYQVE